MLKVDDGWPKKPSDASKKVAIAVRCAEMGLPTTYAIFIAVTMRRKKSCADASAKCSRGEGSARCSRMRKR